MADPEEYMAWVRRQGDRRPMADDRSAMHLPFNVIRTCCGAGGRSRHEAADPEATVAAKGNPAMTKAVQFSREWDK
jgi:hypothetical protein